MFVASGVIGHGYYHEGPLVTNLQEGDVHPGFIYFESVFDGSVALVDVHQELVDGANLVGAHFPGKDVVGIQLHIYHTAGHWNREDLDRIGAFFKEYFVYATFLQ